MREPIASRPSLRDVACRLCGVLERLEQRLGGPSDTANVRPMSFAEAAKKLGVSVRHLERCAEKKIIKIARLGKRRLLAAGECERLATGA